MREGKKEYTNNQIHTYSACVYTLINTYKLSIEATTKKQQAAEAQKS